MIDDQVILNLTGCNREAIPSQLWDGGPWRAGNILSRHGEEFLCEAEQSYLAEDSHPTGNPEDYVLVVVPQD